MKAELETEYHQRIGRTGPDRQIYASWLTMRKNRLCISYGLCGETRLRSNVNVTEYMSGQIPHGFLVPPSMRFYQGFCPRIRSKASNRYL